MGCRLLLAPESMHSVFRTWLTGGNLDDLAVEALEPRLDGGVRGELRLGQRVLHDASGPEWALARDEPELGTGAAGPRVVLLYM